MQSLCRKEKEMTAEPTLRGFIARLQAKSAADGKELSFIERKYIEVVEKRKKRK